MCAHKLIIPSCRTSPRCLSSTSDIIIIYISYGCSPHTQNGYYQSYKLITLNKRHRPQEQRQHLPNVFVVITNLGAAFLVSYLKDSLSKLHGWCHIHCNSSVSPNAVIWLQPFLKYFCTVIFLFSPGRILKVIHHTHDTATTSTKENEWI